MQTFIYVSATTTRSDPIVYKNDFYFWKSFSSICILCVLFIIIYLIVTLKSIIHNSCLIWQNIL